MANNITCPELEAIPNIKHGFFTRNLSGTSHIYVNKLDAESALSEDELYNNRLKITQIMGYQPEQLCILRQIHSDKTVIVQDNWPINQEPEVDAMITSIPGMILGIQTADCVPLLLADRQNGVIAAAHAGWKGARSGIIEQTIATMTKIGANNSTITAAIGPCIHQQSYEISLEFYDNFMAESAHNSQFFKPSIRQGHYMFDLPGYVTHKLEMLDISHIYNINCDTLSDAERFFSYRRYTLSGGKEQRGNLLSVIMLDS